MKSISIAFKFSLQFVLKIPIDNTLVLVQMVACRLAIAKSVWLIMVSTLTHIAYASIDLNVYTPCAAGVDVAQAYCKMASCLFVLVSVSYRKLGPIYFNPILHNDHKRCRAWQKRIEAGIRVIDSAQFFSGVHCGRWNGCVVGFMVAGFVKLTYSNQHIMLVVVTLNISGTHWNPMGLPGAA